jgi:hypothetical protein
MVSYPTAIAMLILCFVGALVWAWYVELSISGMALLFGFLLAVSLIATKLRTECGVPFSYLGPHNAAIILMLLGGAMVFGAEALLFGVFISILVGGTPFYLIPGAQMELSEIGRRVGIRPKHLLATVIIGILGGMFIGGWAFMASTYGRGAVEQRYSWAYDSKGFYFAEFRTEMNEATKEYFAQGEQPPPGGAAQEGMDPRHWGYFVGGGITGIAAVLRQLFAGFWFHPVGFLLASTHMAQIIWGSCLVAFFLRTLTLRFGGAAVVRKKLQPLFVGVFIGTIIGHTLLTAHSAYLISQGVETVFRWNLVQALP